MNRITRPEMVRSIDLDRDQLLVLQDRAGARARVLFGEVWLTEEGQPEDRFAGPGEELSLASRGRAVLEGLGPARIEISEPVRGGTPRWYERLATLRLGAGRALAELRPAWLGSSVGVVLSLVIGLGLPELLARGFQLG